MPRSSENAITLRGAVKRFDARAERLRQVGFALIMWRPAVRYMERKLILG